MKIAVVIGITGEFSDRSEEVIKAFRSVDDAKAFVEAATVQGKNVRAEWKIAGHPEVLPGYQMWDWAAKTRTLLDPGLNEDYRVEETELMEGSVS